MEDSVKKFDPADALLSVKERIKDAFVSLIPEDHWNEMVKKEIDDYFKRKDEGYGERGASSSFTKTVHALLEKEVEQRVKTYLNENFTDVWFEDGVPVCNAKVEEIITRNAGKVLSDMIGAQIQIALSQAGLRR